MKICRQLKCFNPPVVYSTDYSGFVVFTTGRFMTLSLALLFVLVLLLFFFPSPFSIVITSLGEERAGLWASRACVCLFCTR